MNAHPRVHEFRRESSLLRFNEFVDSPLSTVKDTKGAEHSFKDANEDNAREKAKKHLKEHVKDIRFNLEDSNSDSEREELENDSIGVCKK